MNGIKLYRDDKRDTLIVKNLFTDTHTIRGDGLDGTSSKFADVSEITADSIRGLTINGPEDGPSGPKIEMIPDSGIRLSSNGNTGNYIDINQDQIFIFGGDDGIAIGSKGITELSSAVGHNIRLISGAAIIIEGITGDEILIGTGHFGSPPNPVSINYIPTGPGDWGSVVPTTLEQAINLLAAKNAPVTP